ncbi:MAG: DUF4097 family beta strand repeat-containing protein [Myxococcota bacterium]
MSQRDARQETEDGFPEGRGLGGFLRSLLSGIPWSDRAEREESFELPSPASAKVKIFNGNGRTRIVGEERADVAVRALKIARAESDAAAQKLLDQIHVDTRLNGDILEIDVEIPRRWNRHGNVHLDVRLPRDHRVAVRSSNGKLCIEGMRCAVRARSSNGPIKLTDVVGDIEVHTSNAKVACGCTRGRLLARSSNGKIELDDHCGSVDASTSNGIIHARLEEVGALGVSLATSNGRIVLELPEKVDADLDMRVDNGIIRNDRELADQSGANGRIRGTLGHGGSLIKLRTSNGSISVR